tara:strand:- start:8138 stop:8320 length:183 start_codon:yes stop_codon:yes gene_type:complete
MKKIADAISHPVTVINLMLVGSLGVIEFVHTKAHRSLEADVHGHVHQFLRKHPETCDYIE